MRAGAKRVQNPVCFYSVQRLSACASASTAAARLLVSYITLGPRRPGRLQNGPSPLIARTVYN